jgi:hypothetical protein
MDYQTLFVAQSWDPTEGAPNRISFKWTVFTAKVFQTVWRPKSLPTIWHARSIDIRHGLNLLAS